MAAQAAPVDRPRHPPRRHSSSLDHGTRLQSHTAAGRGRYSSLFQGKPLEKKLLFLADFIKKNWAPFIRKNKF